MLLEGPIKENNDELIYEPIETIRGKKKTKLRMNSPSATNLMQPWLKIMTSLKTVSYTS